MQVLSPETWAAIKPLFARLDREVVVAVWSDGSHRELSNIHPRPAAAFQLTDADEAELYAAHRKGRLLVLLHSHPMGSAEPSFMDSRSQQATGWTWGIVPVRGNTEGDIYGVDEPECWGDSLPIPPLEGRTYLWGIRDCFTLVRDYYRLQGITLPDFPRVNEQEREHLPANAPARSPFLHWIPSCGFSPIQRHERRAGDALTMVKRTRGANEPDHCGIYLGEGKYLEQLREGASHARVFHFEEEILTRYAAQFYRLDKLNGKSGSTRRFQERTAERS